MIPLPKSVIDNIFEPRREIRSPRELEAAAGRLLWDGKDPKSDGRNHFFRLAKLREGGRTLYQWQNPSQRMADAIHWRDEKPAKGCYPVWVGCDLFTNDPWSVRPADNLPLYELLPESIHQGDILDAFYRIAFARWDDMVKIDGYPRVSEPTWKYIIEKFMAFDRRVLKGKNVMAGGCWALGAGFSCARASEGIELPDWQIDVSGCKVAYKETPFYFTIQESTYGEQEEYHIFRARMIYDGGMYDDVDKSNECKRHDTLDDAKAACAKRAGAELAWEHLIGPLNPWGERVWQSSIVQLKKAA